MCGILGYFGADRVDKSTLEQACNQIRHRGPDSHGIWQDHQHRVGFGHVRLAIQDLTESGHQPMTSPSGRFVMAFNGEIYNHLHLREQLGSKAPQWRGHSDTETLLACFDAWGIDRTIDMAVGMFAIALWDREQLKLRLIRDRFGEKPLYYGFSEQGVIFSSELKGIRPLPGFRPLINKQAVALLMRHNYIPAPYSIFRNVYKLVPGSILTFEHSDLQAFEPPLPRKYWSAYAVAKKSSPLEPASESQLISDFEERLMEAVEGQMLSDVKLGAMLSAGTDSALIVSLMQQISSTPVQTFTIGFDEKKYNEAPDAEAIAKHLGTQHETLYVKAQQGLELIDRLPHIYDEPFADSSQIPTTLVMGLASKVVTVALSGDAGDELMGGYARYQRARHWRYKLDRVPELIRPLLGSLTGGAARLVGDRRQDRFEKLSRSLSSNSDLDFYRDFVSYWSKPAAIVRGTSEPQTVFDTHSAFESFYSTMMAMDTISYLPDDILVKVDRAAMSNSLETRVPFLDHHLYEFLWNVPLDYKVRNGETKWLSKQLLYKFVPRELMDRPKKGFSVPLGSWLRGPLNSWAEDLLDSDRLQAQGLIDPRPVQRCWQRHQAGVGDYSPHLWGVLMLQSWLDAYEYELN